MDPVRWLHELDLRRAELVRPVPGGAAVLHSAFPYAHDHNKLSLTEEASADDVAAAAEDVLAAHAHRLVELRHAGPADGLLRHGYSRSDNVVMTYAGQTPPEQQVVRLTTAERAAAATESWSIEQPEWGPEVWRQLGDRITTVESAATPTFLAVRDGAGRVVARTDLYVSGEWAQVEEVLTADEHRGRGYATALVREAVRLAGARQVLLVADVDDWPRRMYERLGFRDYAVLATYRR